MVIIVGLRGNPDKLPESWARAKRYNLRIADWGTREFPQGVDGTSVSQRLTKMNPYTRRPFSWLILSLSALTAFGFFFIPAFIIRPFHHQTPGALGLAMALRQHAPQATLIAAMICFLFAFLLWQHFNLGRKIVLASVLALVAFSAVMSRLNYFEWMFHPVDAAEFEAESTSKLENPEMILAIRFADDARAYPIREMAYHHIFNDVVGGVPVAVTY